MGTKLGGNGRWESNRIILPEHRQEILRHAEEKKKKPRPYIDSDQIEEFEQLIQDSFGTGKELRISIFQEYEDRTIIGSVLRIDVYGRRVRIAGEWVPLSDIVKIEEE